MKKGLQGWVEIFKGGPQYDATGRQHDGDALIDKAVGAFNADQHEPPVVIGHPRTDDPAYAWVSGLRKTVKNGLTVLEATFKDIAPDFESLVQSGSYKKRSAAFYPDGSLRHVGFLGAAPPAVKGLANVAFLEGDGPCFEFGGSDWSIARVFRSLREWLIEKFDTDTADRIVSDWHINEIQRAAEQDPSTAADAPVLDQKGLNGAAQQPLFTEDEDMTELEKLRQQLAIEKLAREKAEGQAKTFKEQADRQTLEFSEADNGRKRQAIAATIDQGIKDGKVLPAWKDMGLQTFMEQLAGVADKGAILEFSEGGKKDPVDPAQWFNRFIATFSAHPLFKDMAAPVTDDNLAFADGGDFSGLTAHV